MLPSQTMSWCGWRQLYPETLVLSPDTGFRRDYGRDPFLGFDSAVNAGRFVFPVSAATQDDRLRAGAKVLVVRVNDDARAYPPVESGLRAWPDTVGEQQVVVLLDGSTAGGGVFIPLHDDRLLTIVVRDGQFVDQETGSVWNLAGRALSGPLVGAQLTPLPTKTTFWYAAIAAEPDIRVY
ncbi:MAG: DUF3179 domain-containing protein [Chloroflexi bacterium]|nr:DUF3179 domain-containing protein [Chloroflexota bacterium]